MPELVRCNVAPERKEIHAKPLEIAERVGRELGATAASGQLASRGL